jgi:uncharacterized phage protein (TIGR01671 family)
LRRRDNMREIEFRGKRTDTGEWVCGDLIHSDFDDRCVIYCMSSDEVLDIGKQFEIIPETVGQYTGLKDKNGVKIFEGDIVASESDRCGDIQLSHGMFGIEWADCKKNQAMIGSWGQLHNLRRMDDGFNEKIEVIANIHDNPEFLKTLQGGGLT